MATSVSLKILCELITKGTTPTSIGFDFAEEGIGFLRVQNISGGTVNFESDTLFIDEQVHQSLKRSQILPGDVLLSIAGSIGRTGVVPENAPPLNCNQAVAILRTSEKIHRPFLRHWLECEDAQKQMRGATVTGTIQNLSLTQIGELKIPLPTLPEQRRIADILDQADILRAKRREALAQLDELQQAVFIEMFGDPVRGNGQYPVASVESIAAPEKYSIVDGPFGSSMKSDDYRESGIPVIRIANITKDGRFIDRNLLYIDRALFEKLKRSSIQAGDVLVSRVGTIGNTCIFPEGIDDALLSTTGVCKITPDKKRMLPVFLHQAILQPAFQAQIHKSASTSVQKYFNLSALKDWSIIVPPISAQLAFAEKLSILSEQRAMLSQSLLELDSLFSSLQHRAFRGEL